MPIKYLHGHIKLVKRKKYALPWNSCLKYLTLNKMSFKVVFQYYCYCYSTIFLLCSFILLPSSEASLAWRKVKDEGKTQLKLFVSSQYSAPFFAILWFLDSYWSAWGPWGSCSDGCGVPATISRLRFCTPAKFGGITNCFPYGPGSTEEKDCTKPCGNGKGSSNVCTYMASLLTLRYF